LTVPGARHPSCLDGPVMGASPCKQKMNNGCPCTNGDGNSKGAAPVTVDCTDGELDLAREKKSRFISKQVCRSKRIILIRHGESEGNKNRKITQEVPDHLLHLTEQGRQQAWQAGKNLKNIVGDESVEFVTSPYVRAVETLFGVSQPWGGKDNVEWHEDVYIREQDFGNFDKPDMREVHKEKKLFGKFYYRFPEGESPADLYMRAGLFLESLYRKWESKYTDNLVIISHELFILVFLMRMFRWPVKDFYAFEDLKNCTLVVLEREGTSIKFEPAYTWAPEGEKVPGGIPRKPHPPEEEELWDGRPERPMIQSLSRKPK